MEYEIELENVSFAYGALSEEKNSVLDCVNLKVASGECICITGSSGCGKTTLTRLINGLIPAFYEGEKQGRVFVKGVELELWEMDSLCRTVGSVFQNPRSQFFNLDTTSELAYGCENLGVSHEEILRNVAHAVASLNLQSILERDIHDLSGGQRQLLSLGAACAMGADIFVLDEPTANLDAAATQAVKRTLQDLKKQGKTILIVEHRLHWLDGLVDRVVRMDAGRVVNDWTACEFASLPIETVKGMGLRAWSLESLKIDMNIQVKKDQRSCGDNSFNIQADGLRAGYDPRKEILKGLSFSASSGHAIAIVGHNGQGKSTMARVIAGLMPETYGGISVNASPLPMRNRSQNIYLVLQESGYQLFGTSVRNEFAIGMESSDVSDTEHVDNLIMRFGLEDKADRHPASLSGGEKQRLALAVGIHAGAELLVLDEPTSGLDLTNMQRCAAEIRGIADSGRCVFVITHDAELVAAACDQVIAIANGKVDEVYDLNSESLPRALQILTPDLVDAYGKDSRKTAG